MLRLHTVLGVTFCELLRNKTRAEMEDQQEKGGGERQGGSEGEGGGEGE